MIETISLIGHVAGFVVTIVPLWVLCPKNSAHSVFIEVTNGGGWSNSGTACLVGQISVLYCNLGSDSVVYISEEVEEASLTVSRVMWWSYILDLALGIIMLVTMLFCMGPLESALDAPTPYLQLFNNTGSFAISLALNIFLFILIFSGNITALATTSREMFPFARDKGLPASRWISKMDTKRHFPFNAVYITNVLTGVFCLINLGSSLAFNIIVSLTVLALLSTYMLSISCVLLKRLTNQPLPPARWSLGRRGLAINAFAFVYSAFVIVFSCFPVSVPVTLGTANWAPVVWVGVMLASGAAYWGYGKRRFTAPVVFVEGWRREGVGNWEAQMQGTGRYADSGDGMESGETHK